MQAYTQLFRAHGLNVTATVRPDIQPGHVRYSMEIETAGGILPKDGTLHTTDAAEASRQLKATACRILAGYQWLLRDITAREAAK